MMMQLGTAEAPLPSACQRWLNDWMLIVSVVSWNYKVMGKE